MTQLVDDQAVAQLLRSSAVAAPTESVYTTGLWYVRLCQTVLGGRNQQGKLSGRFRSLPEAQRQQALRAVAALPSELGLISLRDLAPRMGQLRSSHQLNLLGIEVLAAAIELEAEVVLSAPAPRLEAALSAESRPVRRLFE